MQEKKVKLKDILEEEIDYAEKRTFKAKDVPLSSKIEMYA